MNYTHDFARPSYRPRVLVPFPVEDRREGARLAFASYLGGRRLDVAIARANGWYPTEDEDGRLRIVIPATNSGRFPFWQSRAVSPDVTPRYDSPHGVPREDSIVIVWPLTQAQTGHRTAGIVAVVEGPMDALAAAGAGIPGVALMGATPPEVVFGHMARVFPHALFVVIPDSDFPEAGVRSVRLLAQRGCIAQLRLLPDHAKDLAELSPRDRELVLFGEHGMPRSEKETRSA